MRQISFIKKNRRKCQKILKKYTRYDTFRANKDDAYKVSKLIGVSICPYCNEQFIYTINGVCRPEFDHYFSQHKYPELALKIGNLVPSCHISNSIKHDEELNRRDYLYPYKEDFDSILEFSINLIDIEYFNEDNFEIKLTPNDDANEQLIKKATNNADLFKIEERYKFYKDVVVDIFKKIKFYNNFRENEISTILDDSGHKSYIPFRNILFPGEDCDINSTILGKLKRDVIKNFLD